MKSSDWDTGQGDMQQYAFHHAAEYRERGWSVIPLTGKTAAIRWSPYQHQRPTFSKLRFWFGCGNPRRHNVGIVTGQTSGLVVVDCDTEQDARWWADSFAPTPLVVSTGGGGAHFYYQNNDFPEVRNRTRILGRKIDLRGSGGYVVAPPSTHPETGRSYNWCEQQYYALADVPEFQMQWLGHKEQFGSSTARTDATVRDGRAYISRIHAVSGDGGQNATFRAACKLRDAGMTPDEALAALTQWNETNARPRWSIKELCHKVEDAYSPP